jgi:protein gp37
MAASGIEWTEKTWNPATGCAQVSAGCENCYAMHLVNTRQVVNSRSPRFGHPFDEVMLHDNRLTQPTTWAKPTRVFVNSMSDVWHRDIPDAYIDAIFDVMDSTPRHTFQVLSKRAERMMRYVNRRYPDAPCPAHVWLGVSVEDERVGWRADMLRRSNASVRWISAEPLLGSLRHVALDDIDWVVAGGESGRGARPMHLDWARELRDRCVERNVAFFLKQLGGEFHKRGKNEAILDARRWTEYPTAKGGVK